MTVCTFVFMHCLIIYSYTQCKDMLYGLCSLWTNLNAYPYTINLTYYNTMVLITKNYFSDQTCKLHTSDCKCQDDLIQYCSLHCSCVTFLLQQQNYKVTTTTTAAATKDLVMYYSTEHVCRLIYFFLLVLCFMYNFVFAATTQLHSNNNKNTHKKINLHKLLNFQSHISLCCQCQCCCYCVIMLLLLLCICQCASTISYEQEQKYLITTTTTTTNTSL